MTIAAMDVLARSDFVQLTTFRRSGTPMPTPVWIVEDGGSLYVTTPAGSGKVKRLRNNPTVELKPCSRQGKPVPGPTVTGTAEIIPDDRARFRPLFSAKYGLQYRIVLRIEKMFSKGNGRLILRITLI